MRWDPRWREFELADYIATLAMGGVAFGSLAIAPNPERWTEVNSFDAEARSALRPTTLEGRHRARDLSDILLTVSINQLLIDTLLVTWWGHGSGEVAWQMALMNVEALAFNSAINGVVSAIASRERPYRDQCVGDAATELSDCRKDKRYRSYYSGHTSTAFTVAGLTCMHHSYLPLYGGGVPDGIACATSVLAAGTTGLMRVVGDQHFLSDVLTGAVMGTISGTAVPYFLHYRTGDLPDVTGDDGVSLQFVPMPTGGALIGHF